MEVNSVFPPLVWLAQFLGGIGGFMLASLVMSGVKIIVTKWRRQHFVEELFSKDASTRFGAQALPVSVVTISMFFLALEMMSTRGTMWMFGTAALFRFVLPILLRTWRVIRGLPEKWIFFGILGGLIAVTTLMIYSALKVFDVSQPGAYAIGFLVIAPFNPFTLWFVQQMAREENG